MLLLADFSLIYLIARPPESEVATRGILRRV